MDPSISKISQITVDRNAIREIGVVDLLALYGVDALEREQLLRVAEESKGPVRWRLYEDILLDWFPT